MLRVFALIPLVLLAACSDPRQYTTYTFNDSTEDLDVYRADNKACQKFVYESDTALESGLGGALLGAAIGGATAMALGADAGFVATSGAATGGIVGLSNAAGENEKKIALVNCMQNKGHKVKGVQPVGY